MFSVYKYGIKVQLSPCSENRYLLFLTEHYAALDVLEHFLNVGGDTSQQTEEERDSEDEIASKPFVLFGSSFPKDKEYTQVQIYMQII